jgi:hypothetical protein
VKKASEVDTKGRGRPLGAPSHLPNIPKIAQHLKKQPVSNTSNTPILEPKIEPKMQR